MTVTRIFRCNQCQKEAREDDARHWYQLVENRPDFNFSPSATKRVVWDLCSVVCLKDFTAALYDPRTAHKAG